MLLGTADQKHLTAAVGYMELKMFLMPRLNWMPLILMFVIFQRFFRSGWKSIRDNTSGSGCRG